MAIAEILRALMNRTLIDEKPISENRLADETTVPQPTIHRILVGESKDPKSSTVKKLADYWGLTVAQLRGEEPLPPNFKGKSTWRAGSERNPAQLMEMMRHLPVEDLTIIEIIIDAFAQRHADQKKPDVVREVSAEYGEET
jgi:hypothetical protein